MKTVFGNMQKLQRNIKYKGIIILLLNIHITKEMCGARWDSNPHL